MEATTVTEPRQIRRPELKTLLIRTIRSVQPDFRFLTYATGVYHFQRTRYFRDYDLKEVLHIVYSFTDNTMCCSVSSRLNPVYVLSPIYNSGMINPHADLLALKMNLNILPVGNSCYRCDGSPESVNEMVWEMVADFRKAGIPYFDSRWRELKSNQLVIKGLQMIDTWDFDKTMLKNELSKQLKKAKYIVGQLRHPLCNQFRDELASIPGQSREARQEIPRLAFDLMELYCNSKITPS